MKIDLIKFEEYLENKGLKKRSVENYIYYFNKFNFESFNQESISRFLSIKENRNSNSRGFLVNYQKFLMTNYKELGLSQDQRLEIGEVELPKITGRIKQRIIRPLTKEEIHKIEDKLPDEKLKLQLLLSFYCGLRLGELLKIEVISFNWDQWKKNPNEMGECRVLGKGDKEGIALVPALIMRRIAKYIRSSKFKNVNSKLFMKDGHGLNIQNRGRVWQMKLRQAGIDAGVTQLDKDNNPIKETAVHPHRLRHSWASYLLNEKGLDIREIQEIMRHSSISSTQIYTHLNKSHLKKRLSS